MTEARLLSLVAPQLRAALQKGSAPAAIGIHSETRWQGPVEITLDSVRLPVAQCDSVLAAREQLAAMGSDWLAIVTPLELTDLGADVEARLLRHRLFRVEPWDLLRTRFNARTFDGSLLGKAALAEAAVEALGATNPDPAPAGVLTAESVWRVVIENRLGVDEARPDARKWLEWAQGIAAGARWRALGDDLKGLLVDWIAGYLGDWAITFAGCLDAGYGQQAMALGLALGVVRQARQDAQERVILAQASGRMEQYSGGRKISVQAQRVWNEGAEQWATNQAAAGGISTVLAELGEADRILEKTGALPLAWLSKWSVTGFAERLERFSTIDLETEPLEFEARLRDVESHELARWSTRERSWTERARMAARLSRWLETSPNSTKDWAESVSGYVDHGAWVDWARQALTAGDEPEGTAQRWAALCERTARRRIEESLGFGRHLAEVVRQDSFGDAVIPVERLLERVVAPWGKDRVLLILMDGMSFAVWHELCEELVQAGAQLWSWREDRALPPGLSVLPSMTKHSRVSLLCGKLSSGGQDIEKRGFSENPALVAASRSSYPPVLFHKDELAGEAVRKEIRNSQRRVVGVVINVVDDSLDGPDQRTFHWSLGQVPVLRALLTEADTAGRTVIFASDHGHTLERATVLRRVGATDRYHAPEEDAVGSDEVLLTGRRVLEPGGSVIALATEGVRYTASRKMGYHGGATPQECLAPVAVISSASKGPDGWVKTAENAPLWWYAGGATPAEPAPKPKARPAQPLFEGVAGIDRDWIRDLLDAPVFAEQMRNVGGRLDVARTEQALRGLAMRNGVLMKPALAQRIDLPPFRIDGFLSNFERVLNVDGYPVLSVDDSDTVRLDIDLLKKQFGLE